MSVVSYPKRPILGEEYPVAFMVKNNTRNFYKDITLTPASNTLHLFPYSLSCSHREQLGSGAICFVFGVFKISKYTPSYKTGFYLYSDGVLAVSNIGEKNGVNILENYMDDSKFYLNHNSQYSVSVYLKNKQSHDIDHLFFSDKPISYNGLSVALSKNQSTCGESLAKGEVCQLKYIISSAATGNISHHFDIKFQFSYKNMPITQDLTMDVENTNQEVCGADIMPNKGIECAYKYDINPGDTSAADKINAVLASGKSIYFPPGKYIINKSIIPRSNTEMMGSTNGASIFTAEGREINIGDVDYATYISNFSINNTVLENIATDFYGLKRNIRIINNVFITNKEGARHNQVGIDGNQYLVEGNYLGSSVTNQAAISSFGAENSMMKGNYIGQVYTSSLLRASMFLTKNMLRKVDKALILGDMNLINFNRNFGSYRTGWVSSSSSINSTFMENIISGNTISWQGRDHIVYVKHFPSMFVIGNYFTGWPNNASGRVKVRNAENFYFLGNYIDQTGVDERPYNISPPRWLIMRNIFIFDNYFNHSYINYWQNFTDTPSLYIDATHNVVFNNLSPTKLRISATPRNSHGTFYSANNQNSELLGGFVEVPLYFAMSLVPEQERHLLTFRPIWATG